MNNQSIFGLALIIIGILGIALLIPAFTMWSYDYGYCPMVGSMYPGMWQQNMTDQRMNQDMWWNNSIPEYSEALTLDHAKYLSKEYLGSLDNPDLKIKEIMEFEYNFYIIVYEDSTGRGAFEMLIWKKTPSNMGGMMGQGMMAGQLMPEPGPNMMWNTKYGHMMGQLGDMMSGSTRGGGMMNGGMMQQQPEGEMSITEDKTRSIAQEYLEGYFPGTTVVESTRFYGYYTFDFGKDDRIEGMLSVNGYTGQVWYHGWHGDFIQMKEFHD
jgi:hypothetical protein